MKFKTLSDVYRQKGFLSDRLFGYGRCCLTGAIALIEIPELNDPNIDLTSIRGQELEDIYTKVKNSNIGKAFVEFLKEKNGINVNYIWTFNDNRFCLFNEQSKRNFIQEFDNWYLKRNKVDNDEN